MNGIRCDQLAVQPVWSNREEFYRLAEQRGFAIEIVSLARPPALNDDTIHREQVQVYRRELSRCQARRSLHGPFIDITPHSVDASVAAASRLRVIRALEAAVELACESVVFHTGINTLIRAPGYVDSVTEAQAAFWNEMLHRFPSLRIFLENMWEPDPSIHKRILDKARNERLGVCLDSGHANVFSRHPASRWLADLSGAVGYMHWSDNMGDLDSALPIGDGTVDWESLVGETLKLPLPPIIVLEVVRIEAVAKSVAYLESRGWLR